MRYRGLIYAAVFFSISLIVTPLVAEEIRLGLIIEDQKHRRIDDEIYNASVRAFVRTRRFKMLERDELDAVIKEKSLQDFIGALGGDGAGSGLEKIIGADQIGLVSYTIERDSVTRESTYWIEVRMLDVDTGSVLGVIDSRRAGLNEPTTPFIAGNYLYENIRKVFPPQGYVLEVKGKKVTINLGNGAGLKKGDKIKVVRQGEMVIGINGDPLGSHEIEVSTLTVTMVQDRYSTCKQRKGDAVVREDVVRLVPNFENPLKVLNLARKYKKKQLFFQKDQ
jgi:hypothetical protein